MPEIVLNCQNLQCPEPVIQIKRLVESSFPDELGVIVDNEPALENVTRFLNTHGYRAVHRQEGPLWHITAQKDSSAEPPQPPSPAAVASRHAQKASNGKTLVMIISPVFGTGDDSLGARLMKNFLATLPELGSDLWRIILLNGGVTLAAQGSPVIDDLRRLEEGGTSVLVCGTCLEHFALLDKKAVGQTTNMLDVVTSMQLADKVLRV